MNTNDTVAYRYDSTFVASFTNNVERFNTLFDQIANFRGIKLHAPIPIKTAMHRSDASNVRVLSYR
ncbi:Uncharacterised protein [Vibrio cholerae]|nr:Uncharacterised protein [Vibrio cholerae]